MRGEQENPVVIAVKASKEIRKSALIWALTHVVQPGHCVTLLVVFPTQASSSGRKLWGFPRNSKDCGSSSHKSSSELNFELTDSCSQMILQLHDVYDSNKINISIKIVSGSPCGAVAAEAKRAQAKWVVLDKHLKHEEKHCMEELQCNIVVLNGSQAKVLRLDLVGSSENESETECLVLPSSGEPSRKNLSSVVTPTSSPENGTSFTCTEARASSVSSSDPATSTFSYSERNEGMKKFDNLVIKENDSLDEVSDMDSLNDSLSSARLRYQPWISDYLRLQERKTKSFLMSFSGNVREAISLSEKVPRVSPPLCSICDHKAPEFGKAPRLFTYSELELATGGFSQASFLAEGGFGSVHRGLLPDGQAVAVKQHGTASSQGDVEFCSEVQVLSCAQHRNVVKLIGFCIAGTKRLLVYEYICNGSMDSHLYGYQNREALEWSARQKVAVGAARGLRYLHEECRVGCIVHRDMRPNNILITHDFEALVGDFGLARWQPNGDTAVETRVLETLGYLAPEYVQSGQITEKTDVFSFGMVLIELVTGRKAIDFSRPKGQQYLLEWVGPLMEEHAIEELVDPRLYNHYSECQVYNMLHAATLCIRIDSHARPRMSQVLRILEGDMVINTNYTSPSQYV